MKERTKSAEETTGDPESDLVMLLRHVTKVHHKASAARGLVLIRRTRLRGSHHDVAPMFKISNNIGRTVLGNFGRTGSQRAEVFVYKSQGDVIAV